MENLDKALDKMVKHLYRYEEIEFLDLVQFVWRRGWSLNAANEPVNDDKRTKALKACLLERMTEIWSSPPKNALETAPEWCASVPALEERYSVIKPENQSFWESEIPNPIFEKRNIFAPKEFMFFL